MNNIYDIVTIEEDVATSVERFDGELSGDKYNCNCPLAIAIERQLGLGRVRVGSYIYIYGSGAAYQISDAGKDLISAFDNAILYGGNDLAKVKAYLTEYDIAQYEFTFPYTVIIERIEERK